MLTQFEETIETESAPLEVRGGRQVALEISAVFLCLFYREQSAENQSMHYTVYMDVVDRARDVDRYPLPSGCA